MIGHVDRSCNWFAWFWLDFGVNSFYVGAWFWTKLFLNPQNLKMTHQNHNVSVRLSGEVGPPAGQNKSGEFSAFSFSSATRSHTHKHYRSQTQGAKFHMGTCGQKTKQLQIKDTLCTCLCFLVCIHKSHRFTHLWSVYNLWKILVLKDGVLASLQHINCWFFPIGLPKKLINGQLVGCFIAAGKASGGLPIAAGRLPMAGCIVHKTQNPWCKARAKTKGTENTGEHLAGKHFSFYLCPYVAAAVAAAVWTSGSSGCLVGTSWKVSHPPISIRAVVAQRCFSYLDDPVQPLPMHNKFNIFYQQPTKRHINQTVESSMLTFRIQ